MSTGTDQKHRQQASTYSVSGFDGMNGDMVGRGAQSLFTSVSVDSVDRRLR